MLNIIKEIKKQEWIYIFLCVITIITQVFFELKIPDYMSEITKLVQTEGSDISEILKNGIFMLLCALSSMGICVIARFCSSKTSAGISMRLRSKVFNKIMSFNNEEMSKFSTASLITRNTNDINRVQMMVAIGLQGVIKAPIMLTFAITKISLKQWEWSAVVGAGTSSK
jgi:ATP-binding cassette subfamily B protein